jgi:uncharacterized coiled-coil protein SlyX
MFTVNLTVMPQTQREDIRAYNRRAEEKYRNKRKDGLDLLRKCIPGTEKLSGPQILKNAVNYIQQLLNPNFMVQDQEMLRKRHKKDSKEHREKNRIKSQQYRNVTKEGYNLLRKWVPGTSTLSKIDLLKKAAKYIQELEQRSPVKKRGIQELEQKIKELEKECEKKENYIKGLEAKIKELETSHRDTAIIPTDLQTDIDIMPMGTGLSSLMAAYLSEPNSPEIAEPDNLWDIWEPERGEESLTTFATPPRGLNTPTFSPVKMFSLMEEEGETEESVSHEEEELPEFNTIEDLKQWLGLCSEEVPESASPEEEEELPEFNYIEELKQWLGL